jgi:hypothetical protein
MGETDGWRGGGVGRLVVVDGGDDIGRGVLRVRIVWVSNAGLSRSGVVVHCRCEQGIQRRGGSLD